MTLCPCVGPASRCAEHTPLSSSSLKEWNVGPGCLCSHHHLEVLPQAPHCRAARLGEALLGALHKTVSYSHCGWERYTFVSGIICV